MIWRVRFVRRGSGDFYVMLEYADKASASLREVQLPVSSCKTSEFVISIYIYYLNLT